MPHGLVAKHSMTSCQFATGMLHALYCHDFLITAEFPLQFHHCSCLRHGWTPKFRREIAEIDAFGVGDAKWLKVVQNMLSDLGMNACQAFQACVQCRSRVARPRNGKHQHAMRTRDPCETGQGMQQILKHGRSNWCQTRSMHECAASI